MDSSEFLVTNSSFANNSADYVQNSVFAERNDPDPPLLGLGFLHYRSFFFRWRGVAVGWPTSWI